MYKGFNLQIDSHLFESNFLNNAKHIHEDIIKQNLRNSRIVHKRVDELLLDDGSISAKDIIDDWFKSQSYDIFLSHSHADKDLAMYLAVWLKYHLNLDTFIDSIVWGNFTDLAQELNRKYSRNLNKSTYDYDKAQNVFTHVNALLNTSLTNMIDDCECVFFLNTANSIAESDYKNSEITLSPWIYHELLITKVVREKLDRQVSVESKKSDIPVFDSITESIKIKYNTEISHLFNLDNNSLIKWKTNYKLGTLSQTHALDILYATME